MSSPLPSLQLGKIGQIAITVKDLERAIVFYRDALGIPFLFRVPNLAFFDCGGVRLMLGPAEGVEDRGNSVLYFRVDDIERACETLAERGVSFDDKPHLIAKMPDHELWMAFFRDPDRNLMGLMSEVRRG
jgi:catechol 2,3-dioxygenase-like lactoylglutathione lyase family enzyme